MVTPAILWLAVIACAALAGAAALCDLPRVRGPRWFWLFVAAVFVFTFGAKIYSVFRFATPHPYWDQWEEAQMFYAPYLGGTLPLSKLFERHGEHVIALTRVMALALFDLNRQWDNQVQAVTNGLVHALLVAWLVAALTRECDWLQRLVVAAAATLLAAVPFARENVVWGYQSQFYFLATFAVLALWLVARNPPLGLRWWLGAACAVTCIVSLGSGAFCALAVVALALVRIVGRSSTLRTELANLVVFGALAIGPLLSTAMVTQNALHPKGIGEFLTSTGRTAAYPFIDTPWLAPLLWSPLIALVAVRLFRRRGTSARADFAIALGVFALLHSPAVAYARGVGGAPPATRYFDLLALGLIANLIAGFELADALGEGARKKLLATALAWTALVTVGAVPLARRMVHEVSWFTTARERQTRILTEMRNGRAPASVEHPTDLTYPEAGLVMGVLADPFVQSVLSWDIRPPLPLPPQTADSMFQPGGVEAPLLTPEHLPALGSLGKYRSPLRAPFRSRELPRPTLPYLRVELGGYLSSDKQRVSIESAAGEITLRPEETPGLRWLGVLTRSPAGPFRVRAVDEEWSRWFGFRPPVEVGGLSYLVGELLPRGKVIGLAGFALGLLALALALFRPGVPASAANARPAAGGAPAPSASGIPSSRSRG